MRDASIQGESLSGPALAAEVAEVTRQLLQRVLMFCGDGAGMGDLINEIEKALLDRDLTESLRVQAAAPQPQRQLLLIWPLDFVLQELHQKLHVGALLLDRLLVAHLQRLQAPTEVVEVLLGEIRPNGGQATGCSATCGAAVQLRNS